MGPFKSSKCDPSPTRPLAQTVYYIGSSCPVGVQYYAKAPPLADLVAGNSEERVRHFCLPSTLGEYSARYRGPRSFCAATQSTCTV